MVKNEDFDDHHFRNYCASYKISAAYLLRIRHEPKSHANIARLAERDGLPPMYVFSALHARDIARLHVSDVCIRARRMRWWSPLAAKYFKYDKT